MICYNILAFSSRLCMLKCEKELEEEECFEPLFFDDGSDRQIVDESGIYENKLVLPEDYTCEHCVLRWHYKAGIKKNTNYIIHTDKRILSIYYLYSPLLLMSIEGNNWGECEDGTHAIGCGNQETFRSCADISIS